MPKAPPGGERPVILCCGHADRGDDAIGPLCAEILEQRGIPCHVISGGTSEFLDAFSKARRVIVVDAIVTGKSPPGTLHLWKDGDAGFAPEAARCSAGGLGLAQAVKLGRMLKCLPQALAVAGLEASGFEWGAPLSPLVAAQLEALAVAVEQEWRASFAAKEGLSRVGQAGRVQRRPGPRSQPRPG